MQHDENYRRLFAEPRMIEWLITRFVDLAELHDLDYEHMVRLDTAFVTQGLQQRESDLIWKIPTRQGEEIYLCVLLEFQSRVDHAMASRCLTYTALLYDNLLTATPSLAHARKLPLVFPIVLYNQRRPWTASRDVQSLVTSVPEPLVPYQPHQSYFLIDEFRLNAQQLHRQKDPVSLMFLFERSTTIKETKKLLDALVEALKDEPEVHTLGKGFATWLKQALPSKHIEIAAEGIHSLEGLHDMFKENMDAYWQKVHDDAQRSGLTSGLVQGLEQGLEQGQRKVILTLLTLKFGEHPDRETRLQALTLSQVDRLIERLLTATSEDELFAQDVIVS